MVRESAMVIFGGIYGLQGQDKYLNDMFSLDLETMEWELIDFEGQTGPSPRSRHAMCWSMVNNTIYVYGGSDDSTIFGDLWSLDIETNKWKLLPGIKGQVPSPRWGMTMHAVGESLFIYGGHSMETRSSTSQLYHYHIPTGSWNLVQTIGQAWPRAGHCGNLLGSRYLVYFGGSDGRNVLNNINIFDTLANEWMAFFFSPYKAPNARWAHASAAFDGDLYVFGGSNGPTSFSDLYVLSISRILAQLVSYKVCGSKTPSPRQALSKEGSREDLRHFTRTLSGGESNVSVKKTESVVNWLRSVGLSEYATVFAEEGITMKTVPYINETHLDALGIDRVGARLQLMAAVDNIKRNQQKTNKKQDSQSSEMLVHLQETVKTLTEAVSELRKLTGNVSGILRLSSNSNASHSETEKDESDRE